MKQHPEPGVINTHHWQWREATTAAPTGRQHNSVLTDIKKTSNAFVCMREDPWTQQVERKDERGGGSGENRTLSAASTYDLYCSLSLQRTKDIFSLVNPANAAWWILAWSCMATLWCCDGRPAITGSVSDYECHLKDERCLGVTEMKCVVRGFAGVTMLLT